MTLDMGITVPFHAPPYESVALQSARGECGAARDFLTLCPRGDRGHRYEDQGEGRYEHPLIAHDGSGTSLTSLTGSV
ncbi:hypothetical protein SSPIM334S_08522 [Streptomyces spiroverticillatus]